MILFPCCKINIGLHVLSKRPDGYHNIETVMYPVPGLCDSLEIIPDPDFEGVTFTHSGLEMDCPLHSNLCIKAYDILRERYQRLPGVKMHLHKTIPFEAGLGGGSSDAACTLRMLNDLFELDITDAMLECIAAELGSDPAFFLRRTPQLCTERGEIMEPVSVDLSGKWLLIVKPPFGVSTAQAYAGCTPRIPEIPLAETIRHPLGQWRQEIGNDFEESVFKLHPRLQQIKQALYEAGALYASMSGSGSSLFGLFDKQPSLTFGQDYFVHCQQLP